jgi:PKD repeat protein
VSVGETANVLVGFRYQNSGNSSIVSAYPKMVLSSGNSSVSSGYRVVQLGDGKEYSQLNFTVTPNESMAGREWEIDLRGVENEWIESGQGPNLYVNPQPPTVSRDPAKDPDDDGLYEDVRGTGHFTILDIQALFNNMNSPVVENNSGMFNFQAADDEVSVLDVQALFNELAEKDD